MKKFVVRLKNVDIRHYISILITLVFVVLGIFVYNKSYVRLFETFVDFWSSIKFYFNFLFTQKETSITVTNFSKVDYPIIDDWEIFKVKFVLFFEKFVENDNFLNYLAMVFKAMFFFSAFGGVAFALFFSIYKICTSRIYVVQNEVYESKSLVIWKKFSKSVIVPVINAVDSYVLFLRERKYYIYLWLFIWLLNLNVFSIAIAIISYLIYFCVSYAFTTFPAQLFKLLLDLTLMLDGLPLVIWVVIVFYFYDRFRKKIADTRLIGMEQHNQDFLESQPLGNMVCGTMGKNKTTVISDMNLSQNIIFRNKSFVILRDIALKFPEFNFLKFEKFLANLIDNNSNCGSLAQIQDMVSVAIVSVFRYNNKHPNKEVCSYLYIDHPSFDNSLYIETLCESLQEYAKAFFVYICANYNLSNYSIRLDGVLMSEGNFPLWDNDFLNRDSSLNGSRYAKVLDFDMLRLGKKVEKLSRKQFEFGIFNITEIGKERLNMLELQYRKKSEEVNQRNDMFNYSFKMGRHPSTIAYYPFFKVFCDEQRPTSWGADGRDTFNVINIDKAGSLEIAIPFFSFENNLCSRIIDKYTEWFYKFRYYRADVTLYSYMITWLVSKVFAYRLRMFNRYGFKVQQLSVEAGTLDNTLESTNYYLICKKIYAKRFSTDCFADYFKNRILASKDNFNKLREFSSINATFEELDAMNSYFVRGMLNKG